MRMEGLEPPCLAALDPKSSASTNFATSAYQGHKFIVKNGLFIHKHRFYFEKIDYSVCVAYCIINSLGKCYFGGDN